MSTAHTLEVQRRKNIGNCAKGPLGTRQTVTRTRTAGRWEASRGPAKRPVVWHRTGWGHRGVTGTPAVPGEQGRLPHAFPARPGSAGSPGPAPALPWGPRAGPSGCGWRGARPMPSPPPSGCSGKSVLSLPKDCDHRALLCCPQAGPRALHAPLFTGTHPCSDIIITPTGVQSPPPPWASWGATLPGRQ